MQRNSPIERKPFKRKDPAEAIRRSRERIRRAGRGTRKWANCRRGLKAEFERDYGVTTCEERGPGCMGDNGLGFAHRYKRRFILTKEELRHVALLCNVCHDRWELAGHEKMREAIDRIIADRPNKMMEAA